MDALQRNLYIGIIVFLIAIASILLVAYYTQESSVEYNFKNSISLEEIFLDSRGSGETAYITNVKGNIGTITFVNNGFFTKSFEIDDFLICLEYTQNVPPSEIFSGAWLRPKKTIFVKETETFYLDVDYRINMKRSDLFKYPASGLNVYSIPKEASNPFSSTSYPDFDKGRNDCATIKAFSDPLAFIAFQN